MPEDRPQQHTKRATVDELSDFAADRNAGPPGGAASSTLAEGRIPSPSPDDVPSSLAAVAPFVEQIDKDAEAEMQKIRGRAELAARRKLEEAQAEAEAVTRQARASAEEEARHIAARGMAGVSLEVRRTMLRVQGDIVSEVLDRTREKLNQLRGTPEYAEFLKRLAIQGILALGDDTCVLAPAPADAGVFTPQQIAEIKKGVERLTGNRVNLTISNDLPPLGPAVEGSGVRVYSASNKTLFDNTIAARLERLTNELRMIVAREVLETPVPDALGAQGPGAGGQRTR